jgi:hypothetical protein
VSDETANLLMQATPDRGPARTLMSMVAAIVAVTTTAATGLFGADRAPWAAGILMFGLSLAIAFFWYFRSHIIGRRCFNAVLPFEQDPNNIQLARDQLEKLRGQCEELIKKAGPTRTAKVRANVFLPSSDFQQFGCACILKMDPRLELGMSQPEIDNIRFLPGEGHTGRAFMTSSLSFGPPTVAITSEQLHHVTPSLAYIMSCPLKWRSGVLGVMNIDFCCPQADAPPEEKAALAAELDKVKTELSGLAIKAASHVAGPLGKGKFQPIWLLCGA